MIAVAAGLKKAIGHPYDPLEDWIAIALGAGTALYVACDTGFRTTFGSPARARVAAAGAALGDDLRARHGDRRRRAGRARSR